MKFLGTTYHNFPVKIEKKLFFLLLLICVVTACKKASDSNTIKKVDKVSPISIQGLQKRNYKSTINFEKTLINTDKYSSKLISYKSDNLKVYALVTIPKLEKPKDGFPILIFGHGFHPEPERYGISAKTGRDWRPGDYYRGIPETYAENGYLVITPDYRGHNISEGFDYTQTSYLASTFYAIDVLNLISGLNQIEEGNIDCVFYLGHSMGGDVGLKTLLVTQRIKAASLWSGVSASTLEQAIYYGKFYNEKSKKTNNQSIKSYLSKLDKTIDNLNFEYAIDSGDAINYIQNIKTPIILHHARWETSVPYQWSESLAAKLFKHNKEFELYAYNSKNHLFKDKNRDSAIQRDLDFFNKIKTININKNGN